MKTINTLVKDIEKLISHGDSTIPQEKYKELADSIADKVKRAVS